MSEPAGQPRVRPSPYHRCVTSADPLPPRGLLFDLDGTLVESGPGIFASITHTLAAHELPALSLEAMRSFVGPPLESSFRRELGLDEREALAAAETYRAHYAEHGVLLTTVYPGVEELLRDLRGAGATLTVATTKRTRIARPLLERLGLAELFAAVCGTDAERTDKRHAVEDALAALADQGVPREQCLMVGDRTHDVEGAAVFGLACVGVGWGYGTPEELSAAWRTVATVEGLRALLLG